MYFSRLQLEDMEDHNLAPYGVRSKDSICDYIAGMTDRHTVEEHQRLYDPFLKP